MNCKIRVASIVILIGVLLGGCGAAINNKAYNALGHSDRTHAGSEAQGSISQVTALAAPKSGGTATRNYQNPETETKLSAFSTSFKNATKSRSHNITLASKAIDGKTVEPSAEFSFNDAVGPTTKSNGFKLGRIFIKGKDAKGYGGGVCQVSSTLFNAAEQAGLEVTEHHYHSKPVGYVEKSRDATTSYGTLDFKFMNNKPYPIRVNSYVENETITVEIEAV